MNTIYECPASLEELCLDAFCDNFLCFVYPYYVSRTTETWYRKESSDDDSDVDSEYVKKYKFREPDVFLINEISEKLLKKLGDKKYLCDASLSIFTEKNTRLKKIKLNCCKVTKWGLSVLHGHKLTDIECIDLKNVSIGDILDVLNEWTISNLSSANFSKCSFIDTMRHNLVIKLTRFKNLKSLNISCTELSQQGLEMICQDLVLLEKLDISGTLVRNLEPLLFLSHSIISLSVCDLYRAENFVSTLVQLKLLRHLDVSLCNEKIDFARNIDYSPVVDLLDCADCLPNLLSLDISGWKHIIPNHSLILFLATHPKMEYLGLVLNNLTFEEEFCNPNHLGYPHHITIAGLGNEPQIITTLTKYSEKAYYIQKALYYLFQLTNSFQETRSDILKLVLPLMEMHCKRFGVQMAATACLYNLTRGELSKTIHTNLLSTAVTLTLNAMSTFPNDFQLQKNSLLTLCSDRILQEVNFARFRCAKLVLDSICNFDDVNMNRMAVAICSILAAKISTEETSQLGSRPLYMQKLLSLVRSRVESRVSDITLKFTLSALWNLTDESAATCEVFLKENGAYLFLDVLDIFNDDNAVGTKILGLLNNIAEVAHLRHHLMLDSLLEKLFILLKSENIDVSYFAAGIIAHLASDGINEWSSSKFAWSEMLTQLEDAVLKWKVPESEMVAYRSFKPFFPLLQCNAPHQVQLWAVWAINHVCTKNPKRYCPMLREENGHLILVNTVNTVNMECHVEIRDLIQNILIILDNFT